MVHRVLPWMFFIGRARDKAAAKICVYKATNLVNGKTYIGKTCYGLINRMSSHRHYAATGNSWFARALRKYGVDMFSLSILRVCKDNDEALSEEQRLIQSLKPDYNLTPGGDGGPLNTKQLDHYIETHKHRRVSRFWLGKTRVKGGYSRDALRRPVLCVETNQYFQSQVFAANFVGIERRTLGDSLKRNRQITKGNGAGMTFVYTEKIL